MPTNRSNALGARRVPKTLKILFTGLVLLWAVVYWEARGPQNFLWFCDLANFAVAVAILTESSLILTSQAVSVLLVQILWMIDVLVRALLGFHPIGGTEYMFDPSTPLPIRLISLFHVVVPGVIIWGMFRLGYHRRGWLVQTCVAWVVLPISFWLTDPIRNINWVHGPFGKTQDFVDPPIYLVALMLAYPVLIYLPTHLVLRRLLPETGAQRPASSQDAGARAGFFGEEPEVSGHAKALRWIVAFLNAYDVPFQVVGGIAARAYGAKRPLVDIDLYVPERDLDHIAVAAAEAGALLVRAPERHRDESWDITFMALEYAGERIELGGAESARLFNRSAGEWTDADIRFRESVLREVLGVTVPVMPLAQLKCQKYCLDREVDRQDLEDIDAAESSN